MTLLANNYHFVSESVDTLSFLVKKENFQISPLLKRLINRVTDPTVNRDTGVRILSDFFLFLWAADYSKSTNDRDFWLKYCLNALLRVKGSEEAFANFLGNLGNRTCLNPDLFYGITGWILKSGRLSPSQHYLFYIGVRETILQMRSLVRFEAPWWPTLWEKWKFMAKVNRILFNRGWL